MRTIKPDPERIEALDPDGVLWYGNPDMCCRLRKVEPLQRALQGPDALITGAKAFRVRPTQLQRIEVNAEDGRIKINPLADWQKSDLDAYFERHALPRHPLEAEGFLRRLHALHGPGGAWRARARWPMAWQEQDRVRYTPADRQVEHQRHGRV